MKKQRYISIHQPWPFSIHPLLCHSITHSHSFSLAISASNFHWSMALHSPVVTIMWFVIFPLRRQQNYWSMLSAQWSKAWCVCGCQCAPSSVVANFRLEVFLTRAGDLGQQNNWPHHMRDTPVRVQWSTHTHTHRHMHRLQAPGGFCGVNDGPPWWVNVPSEQQSGVCFYHLWWYVSVRQSWGEMTQYISIGRSCLKVKGKKNLWAIYGKVPGVLLKHKIACRYST